MQQIQDDFQQVFFSTDAGKRVFYKLKAICEGRPHSITDLDPQKLAHAAGMRWVMAEINACLIAGERYRNSQTIQQQPNRGQ